MKYFLDTEFLEGPQQEKFPISLFRKQTPNTIDLISIGIVAEDGREFYAISKDFNLDEAWNRYDLEQQSGDMRNVFPNGRKVYWIRENVLKPIWRELFFKADLDNDIYSNKQADKFFEDVNSGGYDHYFSFKSLKSLINKYGKSNKEIAFRIKMFTRKAKFQENESGRFNMGSDSSEKITKGDIIWDNPEFYAYFADYDWVVFCWLFGKMMNLPTGFPMYCKDLKQMMDDCIKKSWKDVEDSTWGHTGTNLNQLKNHPDYPKQENEHNALADARWNKKLYDFLKTI